ncbi:unnamed protein product [Ectocarpus sp. 6 AP-2014]
MQKANLFIIALVVLLVLTATIVYGANNDRTQTSETPQQPQTPPDKSTQAPLGIFGLANFFKGKNTTKSAKASKLKTLPTKKAVEGNKPRDVTSFTKTKAPEAMQAKTTTPAAKLKEAASKDRAAKKVTDKAVNMIKSGSATRACRKCFCRMEDPSLDKAKAKEILGAPLSTIISNPFTSCECESCD